jgi:ribosome biogenesis GTPase A
MNDEIIEGKLQQEKIDVSPLTKTTKTNSYITLGFTGYPNVGKSSVLNSIVGHKVVSVSRTPGHTKHFQTIHLTPTVRLCDCPGLVFPSYVDRPLQVNTKET